MSINDLAGTASERCDPQWRPAVSSHNGPLARRPARQSSESCEAGCKQQTAPICARPTRRASSPPLTESMCLAPLCAGSVGGTGTVRRAAGRVRGVRSRLLTGSTSISLRMIRCGSPTRPSTRRSTCKAAGHCGGNWSRVCALGGRFEFQGRVPGAAERSSSAPRS